MSTLHSRRLASAFYLCYFAAAGTLLPYLNLFYQQIGMSTHQIGVLAAIPTVTVVIAMPLWGGIADALKLHRRLLLHTILAAMLPVLLLSITRDFVPLAGLVLLHAICYAPIIPLADSAALEMLGAAVDDYGKLRLWGAVGFGLAAWGAGILAERTSLLAIFGAYVGLMAVTALVGSRLPKPALTPGGSFAVGLRQLAGNWRWLGLLVTVLLGGTSFAILNNYFVIYLAGLGAGEGLFGLSVAAAGLSELPMFWFSPVLLRKWQPRGLLILALAAFAARGVLTSLIRDPRWALGVQLLHGVTFSAMWTAAVIYAGRLAPPGLGASAQSALGATLFGAGGAAGALIGAWLYEALGPVVMFEIAAAIALLGLIVFALSEFVRQDSAPVQTQGTV